MKIPQNYDSSIGEQMLIAFTGIFTAVREKHGKSDVTVWNQLEPSPKVTKIGLLAEMYETEWYCSRLDRTVQN